MYRSAFAEGDRFSPEPMFSLMSPRALNLPLLARASVAASCVSSSKTLCGAAGIRVHPKALSVEYGEAE